MSTWWEVWEEAPATSRAKWHQVKTPGDGFDLLSTRDEAEAYAKQMVVDKVWKVVQVDIGE